MASRKTTFPADGGTSELQLPSCAQDALAYSFLARREMGQGRVPQAAQIFFGGPYDVRVQYTGAMDIKIGSKTETTDHVNVFIKGPASDVTVEVFYARDAARTPLLYKVPVSVGTFTLELVRVMRVAFFSPLPPARSGIADYSETLIAHMRPLVELETFAGPHQTFDPSRFDIALYHSATTATTASSTKRRCGIPAWW